MPGNDSDGIASNPRGVGGYVDMEYKVVGALVSQDDMLYLRNLRRTFVVSRLLDKRVAAHIFSFLAEAGQSGGTHHFVTPELVGAAVGRLVSNYTEDDSWLPRFLGSLLDGRDEYAVVPTQKKT